MYRASKLIAATTSGFSLKAPRTLVIDFAEGADIDLLRNKKLSLHIEHIRGKGVLPVIDIYLATAQGQAHHEENYIGGLGLYGLEESTENDGPGQDRVFDVSKAFAGRHSKQFALSFVPTQPLPADAGLTIGRVALYCHEG